MSLSLSIMHKQCVGGAIRIYPACPRAEAVADLIGCKVFTLEQLEALKRIGFDITVGIGSKPVRLDREYGVDTEREMAARQRSRAPAIEHKPAMDLTVPKHRPVMAWLNKR